MDSPLTVASLRDSLDKNPSTHNGHRLNLLKLKYRTYHIEFDPNYGVGRLPRIFCDDFGAQLDSYVFLVDPNRNQFEVKVERKHGRVSLTKGWYALHDLYNLRFGAWVTLTYKSKNEFAMQLKDRFHQLIKYPSFVPPVQLRIQRCANSIKSPIFGVPLKYDPKHFFNAYVKYLNHSDVTSGFLMMPYAGFGEVTFPKHHSVVDMINDCGNKWKCTVDFKNDGSMYYNIGGCWPIFCVARRLIEGSFVKIGAQRVGENETIYITVKYD